MKILRIIYDWPPPWTGLAPHPYEVTVSQAKLGHDITVFCGRWPKAGPLVDVKGVKFNTVLREVAPGTITFTSSIILFFKYLLWRRKNRPDIIHSHGPFAIWFYLYRSFLLKVVPWCDELTIPLVSHFHNTAQGRWEAFKTEKKYIMPHSRYLNWPLSVFSDKLSLKVSSASIFVSEATRQEAIKFYKADSRRCFVVESGVNINMFKPISDEEREKSRKELGLDIYDKVVLNYGMMVERKNIHLLIDVLAKLPHHYKLLLVGTGDSAYLQKLSEDIAKKGLEDRVIRVGYTEYPQVPIACQIADIFVLPSTWEGIPKVVMESLACGIPCLVSGFKIGSDIRGVYYLEDLDTDKIAQKVVEIVEDAEKDVDITKIKIEYSWDYKAKQIETIYDFAKNNTLH